MCSTISADGQVTFRWRDSADHNQRTLATLSLDEFLRRFLLHLLPNSLQIEAETSLAQESDLLWFCPKCGGPIKAIERLTAAQLQLRSRPMLVTTAA